MSPERQPISALKDASLDEMRARERYQQIYGKPVGPTVPSARALACQDLCSYLDYMALTKALERNN